MRLERNIRYMLQDLDARNIPYISVASVQREHLKSAFYKDIYKFKANVKSMVNVYFCLTEAWKITLLCQFQFWSKMRKIHFFDVNLNIVQSSAQNIQEILKEANGFLNGIA